MMRWNSLSLRSSTSFSRPSAWSNRSPNASRISSTVSPSDFTDASNDPSLWSRPDTSSLRPSSTSFWDARVSRMADNDWRELPSSPRAESFPSFPLPARMRTLIASSAFLTSWLLRLIFVVLTDVTCEAGDKSSSREDLLSFLDIDMLTLRRDVVEPSPGLELLGEMGSSTCLRLFRFDIFGKNWLSVRSVLPDTSISVLSGCTTSGCSPPAWVSSSVL
mmetsp:Transcript_66474/g.156543  ORF Transcript_66474/g.156543 Transcript_66474/m.156543 type:complete len:219 (+) Transcript_66474:995-1651(+)